MTTRRPKTPKRKRRKTTGETASRRSAADLQKQLDRRTRELAKTRKLLKEALQQQSATSEVLQVINSSAVELASVFDAMLKRAMRLCEAAFGGLWVFEGDRYVAQALCSVPPAYASYLRNMNLVPGPHTAPYRFLQGERSAIQNVDLAAEEPYLTGDPQRRALVDLGGARAALQVPLVRDELVLGVITVYRQEVRPFSEQQVTLLQNFADQAVIAIENVRLFNETQEALERQIATADILRVIATSPSDVQPVFKAIAERSKRLVNALSTTVFRLSDDVMHLEAFTPTNSKADASLQAMFPAPLSNFSWAKSVRRGEIFRVADTEDELDTLRDVARLRGFRSMLLVPLVRDGTPIGLISVTRVEPGPFATHHVHMLQTFADQALIAIENARLFDEVQTRTRDLAESLEQQTATSEVLQVISSSPGELGPVFEQMLEKATRVCGASFGTLNLFDGESFETVALYNVPPAFAASRKRALISPHPEGGLSYVARTKQVAHIHDLRLSPAYRDGSPAVIEFADAGGARTVIIVPMLKKTS